MSTPSDETAPLPDPLLRLDPFVALADGRQQLAVAVAGALARELVDTTRLTEALATVAAHDAALTEVALAWADGQRDFTRIVAPNARALAVTDIEQAMDFRMALFEAFGAISDVLDEMLTTPWGGEETWRMHLVALAMHDGAQAHTINEASSPA